MSSRKIATFSLLMVLVLVLSACVVQAPAAAPAPAQGEEAASSAGQPLRIAYIPQNTGNPYSSASTWASRRRARNWGAR